VKSRLVPGVHNVVLGEAQVVEVWNEDEFIATVYGSDKGGVRVISKYPVDVTTVREGGVNIVEVTVGGGQA
jgi:hypothetical protein